MDKDLRSYVKRYSLDRDTCARTVEELKNFRWGKHNFYNPHDGTYAPSGDREIETSLDNTSYNQYLTQCVHYYLERYLIELDNPYFGKLQEFSQIKFNHYKPGKKMEGHVDHIHSLFDNGKENRRGIPILTCVGLLNEDFEGGRFIMWYNEDLNLKAGDLIIFPSVFLYPHEVTEMISGERFSFVSWAW